MNAEQLALLQEEVLGLPAKAVLQEELLGDSEFLINIVHATLCPQPSIALARERALDCVPPSRLARQVRIFLGHCIGTVPAKALGFGLAL